MLYAILCYNDEKVVWSWTKEQDATVMDRLAVVHRRLQQEGKLGPTARLLPTTAATTLRKGDEPVILDGPFAETKEQLLGFYTVDCDTLEEAIGIAQELARANPGAGGYEIRPIALLLPGTLAR
jgi:hypothetical protein